jgi:hypothetical protein
MFLISFIHFIKMDKTFNKYTSMIWVRSTVIIHWACLNPNHNGGMFTECPIPFLSAYILYVDSATWSVQFTEVQRYWGSNLPMALPPKIFTIHEANTCLPLPNVFRRSVRALSQYYHNNMDQELKLNALNTYTLNTRELNATLQNRVRNGSATWYTTRVSSTVSKRQYHEIFELWFFS